MNKYYGSKPVAKTGKEPSRNGPPSRDYSMGARTQRSNSREPRASYSQDRRGPENRRPSQTSRASAGRYPAGTSGGGNYGGRGGGNRRQRSVKPRFVVLTVLLALIVVGAVFAVLYFTGAFDGDKTPGVDVEPSQSATSSDIPQNGGATLPGVSSEPTPTPAPVPDPDPADETMPQVFGLKTELELDGQAISDYTRPEPINFGEPEDYTSLEGVIAFRGNNYRDNASYGVADVKQKKLSLVWTTDIPGAIKKGSGSGSWTGCGWTGQPLIVKWPKETIDAMNIYDDKKAKDGLVEIIYPSENSSIYFLDLDDGSQTRDTVDGKWTFKGAGALDPRGYPLLYVGSGDDSPNGPARNMIFSLIDTKKIYEYGAQDPFSLRNWFAFDSGTLIDAETDTLIHTAECGIIYTMKLNSNFDAATKTMSVNPTDVLKWRYSTDRSREGGSSKYWLGLESSPVVWRHYLYGADNGGNLFCIDLNTMKTVWVQDVLDDTNCTPVFEFNEEKGEYAIYIGTSTHWTTNEKMQAQIPFWKIDAITGEILWEADGYLCDRDDSGAVSGGIQDTAAIGKNKLSELVYVTFARTLNTPKRSRLVAYDKESGIERWAQDINGGSWSSPLIVYDEDGSGYVVQCDANGTMWLFDGLTGEMLDSVHLIDGNFEASPAAYNGMVVVGNRQGKIFGVKVV